MGADELVSLGKLCELAGLHSRRGRRHAEAAAKRLSVPLLPLCSTGFWRGVPAANVPRVLAELARVAEARRRLAEVVALAEAG